jgi:peroxiredoxin
LHPIEPRLEINGLVPAFTLPSSQGGEVKLWDYKMRKNLVILFYHGSECSSCRERLKTFAVRYEELVKLETEILAISSEGVETNRRLGTELGLPYPLLSDPEGRAIEEYTYWDGGRRAALPSIFVTDRYGTLHYTCIADEITRIPDPEEVLSWLEFIQSQCPECSI